MYKCLKADFDKLYKKILTITNKLDKYGLNYEFEILRESVEPINVIDLSIPNQPVIKDTILVDVVNYRFAMEELKLGDYEVVAVIEHNRIENSNENLIYLVNPEIVLDTKYRTVLGYCEHCNTNRKRNKTVLLQNVSNLSEPIKQVGLTCLKDYTGIEAMDLIRNYMNLNDLLLEETYIDYKNYSSHSKYVETLAYLANSIELIESEGYEKNITKNRAWDKTVMGNNNTKEYNRMNSVYIKKAEEVITYFNNKELNNNFLVNIKLLLQNKYNKCSGLISYAYLAYLKQLEIDELEKTKNDISQQSAYVGTIGDRLTFEVNLIARYSFESFYGYQNIYLFKDCDNNVYKWKTSVNIVNSDNSHIEIGDEVLIKGTIKEHDVYNDVKQTELTRCKIITNK